MNKENSINHDSNIIRGPLFWLLSLLLILFVCKPLFNSTAWKSGGWISLYLFLLYITYSIIYLIPSWVVTRITARLTGNSVIAVRIAAVASVGLTLIFLYTDAFIFKIYGYHINGFVLNLVTTPGGIDSMGGSNGASFYFSLIAGGLILSSATAYFISHRYEKKKWLALNNKESERRPFKWWPVFLAFLLLTTGERVTYSMASLYVWNDVLYGAQAYPFYQPATFRRLAKKMGIKVKTQKKFSASINGGGINYPLKPLQLKRPEKPLNLIWLVAESWRWDMLSPEIMPATWAFAQKSQYFKNHFSGGNGTRMGMFSMFYSLYGPTWFKMLYANRQPLIMEALKKQDYQWDMYTSAMFSYPEFDRTIFCKVEPSHLHADNTKPSWRDDRRNVGEMLDFIEHRDKSKPFMTFMFFESPHARYYFPPENIIRKPYLEELNYATMDLENDMELIFNRYVNANNHLDSQFARVFSYLEENDLLENTVVIVTGDHGEEFMEHGRWGHNSDFHGEQIHVPLIISMPGKKPAAYSYMTSHVDIVPTIAPLFGIGNDLADYSLGLPLLGEKRHEYITSAGWGSIAIIDSQYKIRLPLSNSDLLKESISHFDDTPLGEEEDYFSTDSNKLLLVMNELGRFLQN